MEDGAGEAFGAGERVGAPVDGEVEDVRDDEANGGFDDKTGDSVGFRERAHRVSGVADGDGGKSVEAVAEEVIRYFLMDEIVFEEDLRAVAEVNDEEGDEGAGNDAVDAEEVAEDEVENYVGD